MVVNFQVAFAFNLEIEQPVLRKQIEHVIEKRKTSVDARLTGAVQIQPDADLGLFGLALNVCLAGLVWFFHLHFVARTVQSAPSLSDKLQFVANLRQAKAYRTSKSRADFSTTNHSQWVCPHSNENSPATSDSR